MPNTNRPLTTHTDRRRGRPFFVSKHEETMTIHVRIQVDDSRPGAVIAVKTQNADGSPSGTPDVTLAGNPDDGESTVALVHSGQRIVIEEVSNG